MDIVECVTDNRENCEKDATIFDEASNGSKEPSELSERNGYWYYIPDSILLNIFQYLTPWELTIVGEVCKSWHRVSCDEFLWKDLFYRIYKIDPNIGIMPG